LNPFSRNGFPIVVSALVICALIVALIGAKSQVFTAGAVFAKVDILLCAALVAISLCYIALRVSQTQKSLALAGASAEPIRPITIVEEEETASTSISALERLDVMVGLAPVKREVKAVLARVQVEQ
jgi:hypothetical protein